MGVSRIALRGVAACSGSATAVTVCALALAATFGAATAARAEKLQPVVIRLVADHTPPPHPAALAQVQFAKRVAEVIPGSEVRLYHAGALYTIPEALEESYSVPVGLLIDTLPDLQEYDRRRRFKHRGSTAHH